MINLQDLAIAAKLMLPIVGKNKLLPVSLEADGEWMTLSGSDLKTSIRRFVPCEGKLERVFVDPRLFEALASGVRGEGSVSVKGRSVEIASETASVTLKISEPWDIPWQDQEFEVIPIDRRIQALEKALPRRTDPLDFQGPAGDFAVHDGFIAFKFSSHFFAVTGEPQQEEPIWIDRDLLALIGSQGTNWEIGYTDRLFQIQGEFAQIQQRRIEPNHADSSAVQQILKLRGLTGDPLMTIKQEDAKSASAFLAMRAFLSDEANGVKIKPLRSAILTSSEGEVKIETAGDYWSANARIRTDAKDFRLRLQINALKSLFDLTALLGPMELSLDASGSVLLFSAEDLQGGVGTMKI